MPRALYIGLMSGTSLDGIDAVLADCASRQPHLLAHQHSTFAAELRHELHLLQTPGWDDIGRGAIVAGHLSRAYADACLTLLRHTGIDVAEVQAIGVHGQTIRHRPDEGYTIQLNAPALLAELTGIDVIADFRSRDLAAGGQGAPLAPAFHAAVFATAHPRAIVNIGGMSNLTALIPTDTGQRIIGFDSGPGNVLLDAWAQEHLGEPLDRDGAWAASGHTDPKLLDALLSEPYFASPPPKSTGREQFNLEWLRSHLAGRQLDARNIQATLTRLTARCIAQAVASHAPTVADVLVCGGGSKNPTLMKMLAEECAPRPVASTATAGVDPEHVEALAFAWLAQRFVQREHGNAPSVTGAEGKRILGALYPA